MILLDLLKASGGEESLHSRLGVWRQRISEDLDRLSGGGTAGAVLPGGAVLPPASLAALSEFGSFYALMPGDNTATIATNAPLLFPQDGPASGITRITTGSFRLPEVGVYEVSWQVSIDEGAGGAQLMLELDGTPLANTVAGRATGTNQLYNTVVIATTTPNSVLRLINPGGTALTITPIAGGPHAVSAWLKIRRLG